jgi:O-antigen ligase
VVFFAGATTVNSAVAERITDRFIFALVVVGALSIPLAVLPRAFDAYRLPKEAVLRGEAILIAAVVLAALVMAVKPRRPGFDRWLVLPIVAFVWMIVTTLTSTNVTVSFWHLVAGASTLIVFIATRYSAAPRRFLLVDVSIGAAVANAVIALLQELNVWMPFGTNPELAHHLQCTAFIGNPNELGSYLAVAALGCVAAAVSDEKRRVPLSIAAIILVIGLIAAQSLTAIIAFVVAILVMIAMFSWRRALVAAVAVAALAAVVTTLLPPLRQRAANMRDWAQEGEYNSMLTGRLVPFVAASMMAADHPLTGVGPGAFAWNYYSYKVRAEQRVPTFRRAWNRGVNFGEAHDDHLQVLAEGGVPGYVLFVAIAATLAAISLTKTADAPRERRFAMSLALPLAAIWLTLSLAQFPLETTAVRMLLVHFAALCAAWRTS